MLSKFKAGEGVVGLLLGDVYNEEVRAKRGVCRSTELD
jgi:hypothetical protein